MIAQKQSNPGLHLTVRVVQIDLGKSCRVVLIARQKGSDQMMQLTRDDVARWTSSVLGKVTDHVRANRSERKVDVECTGVREKER